MIALSSLRVIILIHYLPTRARNSHSDMIHLQAGQLLKDAIPSYRGNKKYERSPQQRSFCYHTWGIHLSLFPHAFKGFHNLWIVRVVAGRMKIDTILRITTMRTPVKPQGWPLYGLETFRALPTLPRSVNNLG
jgi:hypothetical protein